MINCYTQMFPAENALISGNHAENGRALIPDRPARENPKLFGIFRITFSDPAYRAIIEKLNIRK